MKNMQSYFTEPMSSISDNMKWQPPGLLTHISDKVSLFKFSFILSRRQFSALTLFTKILHKRRWPFFDFKMAFVRQVLIEIPAVQSVHDRPLTAVQHYPQKIPVTNPKYASPTKRCVFCYKHGVRSQSRYECNTCIGNPGLWINPCFKMYHQEHWFCI